MAACGSPKNSPKQKKAFNLDEAINDGSGGFQIALGEDEVDLTNIMTPYEVECLIPSDYKKAFKVISSAPGAYANAHGLAVARRALVNAHAPGLSRALPPLPPSQVPNRLSFTSPPRLVIWWPKR